MIKTREVLEPESCLNKAREDEMLFVLLARDAAAPHAIREWVKERIRRGCNRTNDAQIREALRCAAKMESERFQRHLAAGDFTRGTE